MKTQISDEQNNHYQIETERLLLRMFKDEDLEAVYSLFNDDDVQKYLSPENKRTRERLKNALKNFVNHWNNIGFGLWCVTEKNTADVIGYCGFQYFDDMPEVEIVFAFLKGFWGTGFATEAANACLTFWYEELAFNQMFAATSPKNTAARHVLDKIGMSFIEKSHHYEMELITYSISRNDYQPNNYFYKLTRAVEVNYSN